MDLVRVGIVGSGFMGRTYAEVLDKHIRGAKLVAVAVGRRAEQLAADYGIAVEPSIEALVGRADIDAVILATPEQMRLEQARVAAVHVLSLLPNPTGGPSAETPMLEYDTTENLFRTTLLTEPLAVRDGFIQVPSGPGLGITVDEDVLRRYQV
jgi:hypothetical protein